MHQTKQISWHLMATILMLMIATLFLAGCVVQAVPVNQAQMTTEEKVVIEAEAKSKGITVEQALLLAQLEDRGPTPELTNDTWLNSEPLRLEDLRGNVVIVEFWTYG